MKTRRARTALARHALHRSRVASRRIGRPLSIWKSGVDADLHVYEGFAHADFAVLFDTPESVQHYTELGKFVSRHLGKK